MAPIPVTATHWTIGATADGPPDQRRPLRRHASVRSKLDTDNLREAARHAREATCRFTLRYDRMPPASTNAARSPPRVTEIRRQKLSSRPKELSRPRGSLSVRTGRGASAAARRHRPSVRHRVSRSRSERSRVRLTRSDQGLTCGSSRSAASSWASSVRSCDQPASQRTSNDSLG